MRSLSSFILYVKRRLLLNAWIGNCVKAYALAWCGYAQMRWFYKWKNCKIICNSILSLSVIFKYLILGRFKYQVRIYSIFLLKTNIGDLKFNFSLGLLLILFCIYAKYCIDMVFILNPFGTYCLRSIFAFSTAPFCHGA